MFQLRPYQAETKQSIIATWDEGERKTLLVLPTVCGITVMFFSVTENQMDKGTTCAYHGASRRTTLAGGGQA